MINRTDRIFVTPSGNDIGGNYASSGGSYGANREQIRELKELQAEIQRLRLATQRSSPRPSTQFRLPSSAQGLREEVEHQIRLQPVVSVALAAIVGFV